MVSLQSLRQSVQQPQPIIGRLQSPLQFEATAIRADDQLQPETQL
jgi:hypothetical protein